MSTAFIHPTATVENGAEIGVNSKVWHYAHVRAGAKIGRDCAIGKDCYIDGKVTVGDGSRIQNGVSVYDGVEIENFVFIGPHVVFTNDLYPRAGVKSWKIVPTHLRSGCSIGAGAIIRCGIEIGSFAMVAAGAIVTKDVSPFTLTMGSPAAPYKKICACGQTHFELEAQDWKPILACCREKLTPNLLALAENFKS